MVGWVINETLNDPGGVVKSFVLYSSSILIVLLIVYGNGKGNGNGNNGQASTSQLATRIYSRVEQVKKYDGKLATSSESQSRRFGVIINIILNIILNLEGAIRVVFVRHWMRLTGPGEGRRLAWM